MKDGDRVEIVRSDFITLSARFIGKRGSVAVPSDSPHDLANGDDFLKVSMDGENRVFTFPKVNVKLLDAVQLLAELDA